MAITNTRGKLASAFPTDTNEAQLYPVPSSSEIDAVLRVCNQTASARTYRVAHTDQGHGDTAANSDDFLFYDKAIGPNDTHEISFHANATETIRIRSSYASAISFHLSGNLKVTS